MPKLSVVIITFNEERNIGRCLESVKGIADEIVVVDSFSTDKTEEICRSFGTKFIRNPFKGHIEQKNFALGHCSHDYIFSLDADEALSEELRKNIVALKENWLLDGYIITRLTNYCGHWIRHGSWYPDRKLRLFRKGSGHWGGENPHDRFLPDKHGSTGRLSGDLLHYSYYSVEGHIKQVNEFTKIAARSAFISGKRSSLLQILFKPVYKFIRDYFFLLGFVDGYYGFIIAVISSHATFLKYVKLKELENKLGTGNGI